MNVLPWYRQVGVVKNLQSDARRKKRAACKNRYVVITWFGERQLPRKPAPWLSANKGTGEAGDNGQYSAEWAARPGQDCRLPVW